MVTNLLAQPHHHHRRRHQTTHSSPIRVYNRASPAHEGTAVVTVYKLNGQTIPHDQVETCLKESRCVIIGHNVNSTTSNTADQGSVISQTQNIAYFQKNATPSITSKISSPAFSAHSAPVTSHSVTVSQEPNKKKPESSASGNSHNFQTASGTTVNKNFPNNQIDCSEFPSQYGPVPADWLGLGGWTGVQRIPGYSLAANAISNIQTANAGEGCTPGSFCSYACPPGYQKSQWPAAQGSTGQSIGGLYCNKDGKLELSRLVNHQLCTPGVGNIQVKNLHSKNVAICRTDYPGTEAETVALNALPGSTVKVTCPDSKEYYRNWEGEATSAQYYINPSGYDIHEACTWGTPNSNLGNWAPVNMGVGKGDTGVIFISLFPNIPTNPNGVLDFKIDITGDVNGKCGYRNGKFYKDGVVSPTGCTVGVDGKAFFEFS